MVSENRWTKVHSTRPDGHALFRENDTDKLAVADNSGARPDCTDDGVLFLDQEWLKSQLQFLVLVSGTGTPTLRVPVLGEDGADRGAVWLTDANVVWLAKEYDTRLLLVVGGIAFAYESARVRPYNAGSVGSVTVLRDVVTGMSTAIDWKCPAGTCKKPIKSIDTFGTCMCIAGHESQ